jgi:2-dehydro-3-deoxyphosphogluconate aldolase / (4S)-4-hydroxy-2-oxoglutarate aldolase
MTILEKMGEWKIVPVVKLERSQDAVDLGKSLIAGGLPVAEITFRTDAAEESIKLLTAHLPELTVGAGTVLTVDNVKKAVDAGAQFIVTPGFNPKVVDYCIQNDIPITPGVNSPTQVEMGIDHGLTVLKFFPAEASGGIAMLKAFAGPYGNVKFVPTGGINAGNLPDYLALKNVLAIGGSWIVKSDLITGGSFEKIRRLVEGAVDIAGTV